MGYTAVNKEILVSLSLRGLIIGDPNKKSAAAAAAAAAADSFFFAANQSLMREKKIC